MSETMELVIAEMEVSEISEKDLENTFQRVVAAHKDAVRSIHQSMKDADDAFRKYLDPNYAPLEDIAKNDRALLNNAEGNIAKQYKTLKSAYEQPLLHIEANIKQIRNAIKEASGVVDGAVKKHEEKQKSKKKQEIADYFDTKKFELVSLEKIFDLKWLNKTKGMKDVREELDAAISAIYRDIEILEKIPEHGMAAKAFYLENLDMGAALRQVETLKANAEKLAREQIERDNRKIQEQCAVNASAERQENREQRKEEAVKNIVDQAVGLPAGTTAEQALGDGRPATATATETATAKQPQAPKPSPATARQSELPQEERDRLVGRIEDLFEEHPEGFTRKHRDWIINNALKAADRAGINKMVAYTEKVIRKASA